MRWFEEGREDGMKVWVRGFEELIMGRAGIFFGYVWFYGDVFVIEIFSCNFMYENI